MVINRIDDVSLVLLVVYFLFYLCACVNISDINLLQQSLVNVESVRIPDENQSSDNSRELDLDNKVVNGSFTDLESDSDFKLTNLTTDTIAVPTSNPAAINVTSVEYAIEKVSSGNSSRVLDLKVVSTNLPNRTVHMKWTSNATLFIVRYHPEPMFLQNYFNTSMADFVVVNESINSVGHKLVHSLMIVLPDEVLYYLEGQVLDRLYFAVMAMDEDGSAGDMSNLAVAYFKAEIIFASRSLFLERVLASMVITSIAMSILVSASALVVIKCGAYRRYTDYKRSDYYYETVTDISLDEQRLANFESRRTSEMP